MYLPSGSVDTHAHVFEPTLAMESGRRYTPEYSATLESYFSRLDSFGLKHGVLVQPSFLGTNNDFLVSALLASGGRCKGVAVVDTGFTAEQLVQLKKVGVEGVRLNLFGRAVPPLGEPRWRQILSVVNELNWHVEVHCPWTQLPDVLPQLHEAGCRVVVDHLGRPDFTEHTDLAQLDYLCDYGRKTPTWVKVSGAYRLWSQPDQAGYGAAVGRLISRLGPSRLMWGSDWPHTQHESLTTISEALLLLTRSVTDREVLEQILVRTPQTFFDF